MRIRISIDTLHRE